MRTPTNDHYVALLKKVMPEPKRDNGTQTGIDALRKSLERTANKMNYYEIAIATGLTHEAAQLFATAMTHEVKEDVNHLYEKK